MCPKTDPEQVNHAEMRETEDGSSVGSIADVSKRKGRGGGGNKSSLIHKFGGGGEGRSLGGSLSLSADRLTPETGETGGGREGGEKVRSYCAVSFIPPSPPLPSHAKKEAADTLKKLLDLGERKEVRGGGRLRGGQRRDTTKKSCRLWWRRRRRRRMRMPESKHGHIRTRKRRLFLPLPPSSS